MADQEAPRYVSTSGVSVGPELDTSNVFNKYAQIFGDIEKTTRPIAESIEQQIGQEQGQLAGENPGFKPGLGIGIASNAYNEAGLASNKLALMADASTKINALKMQAMGMNPDGSKIPGSEGLTTQSITDFNGQLKAYVDGMMQTVPSANRQMFQYYAAAQSTIAQSHLLTQYQKKQTIANTFALANQNQANMTTVFNNMTSGDKHQYQVGTKQLGINNQAIEKAALTQGVNPKYALNMMQQNNKQALYAHYMGVFNQKLSVNPADAMDYAEKVRMHPDVIAAGGVAGANTLYNQFKSMAASRLQSEGVTSQQVAQDVDSLHKMALNGQDPYLNAAPLVQKVYNWNSLKNKEGNNELLDNELSIDKHVYSLGQLANTVPYDKLDDAQQQLVDEQKHLNPSDDMYSYKLVGLQNAYKTFSKIKNLRENDSASWVMKTDGYKSAYQKHAQDPQQYPQSYLDDYIYNAQKADNRPDSSIRMLPVQKSQQIASQLKQYEANHDYASYVNTINSLYAEHPKHAGIIYSNIQNDGKLDKNLELIHEMSANSTTAPFAQGFVASTFLPKSYFSKDTGDNYSVSHIKSEISDTQINGTQYSVSDIESTLHDQGIFDTKFDALKQDAAQYAYYLHNSGGVKDMDKAREQAVQAVFSGLSGNNTFNGRNYSVLRTDILGNEIDNNMVKAAVWYKSNQLLTGNTINAPQGMDRRAYQIELKSKIGVKNMGADGLALVDGKGDALSSKDENNKDVPSTLSYRELADSNSQLRKEIVQDVIKKYGSYTPRNLEKYGEQSVVNVSPKNTIGAVNVLEDIVKPALYGPGGGSN